MHPLDTFKYCPRCGSDHFNIKNEKSKLCKDCCFQYYINPAAAVAAFIVNQDNELLVCRRAFDPAKGTLDLPGGFTDLNETIEEALIREIDEELALTVDNYQYLFSLPNEYYYGGFNVHTMDIFFLIRVGKLSSIEAHDDILSAEFIPIDQIDPNLFGLPSIKRGVQRWLNDNFSYNNLNK